MREHKGPVIQGAEDRHYAYQCERSYPGGYIEAFPSGRSDPEETKTYSRYEFIMKKVTDSSIEIELKKHRKDIVAQRIVKGAAVTEEVFFTTLSFGEFVNRLFGPGCQIHEETEAFPESVVEAMRTAYLK